MKKREKGELFKIEGVGWWGGGGDLNGIEKNERIEVT